MECRLANGPLSAVLPIYPHQETPEGGDDSGGDGSCSVCLQAFACGESLKRLPCLHAFHAHCIDEWLANRPSCPTCRTQLDGAGQFIADGSAAVVTGGDRCTAVIAQGDISPGWARAVLAQQSHELIDHSYAFQGSWTPLPEWGDSSLTEEQLVDLQLPGSAVHHRGAAGWAEYDAGWSSINVSPIALATKRAMTKAAKQGQTLSRWGRLRRVLLQPFCSARKPAREGDGSVVLVGSRTPFNGPLHAPTRGVSAF